jgi:hypothetical protein
MAVVGVGRGGDGALRLAGLDPRFGYAVAIGPKTTPPGARRAAEVIVLPAAPAGRGPAAQSHWAVWRADLPTALQALAGAGFGEPPATAATG